MADTNEDQMETEENGDREVEDILENPGHSFNESRSSGQLPEKTAELFPTDSPIFNDEDRENDFIRRRDKLSFSFSCGSSLRGSVVGSIHSAASEASLPVAVQWPSLSSLDTALENTQSNRHRIDSVKEGFSRYATKMNKWCKKMDERMAKIEGMILALVPGKDDPNIMTTSGLHSSREVAKKTTATAFSWVVPYSELKRLEVMKVLSPQFDLRCSSKLQAELHLRGLGHGEGSHLSLTLMDVRESLGAVGSPLMCRVKVRVENQEDQSEAIEKMAMLDGDASIYKLIPISSVEDGTLNYLVKGLLTITILVHERVD